jgi:hypothetical protein
MFPFLLAAFLSIPLSLACAADPVATPGAGADETVAAKAGKAPDMASLARLYDSLPCRECHERIYEEWKVSPHARSLFGDGRTAAGLRRAVREGILGAPFSGVKEGKDVKVGHLSPCVRCHAPQLADGTDGAAREVVASLDAWQEAKERGDADVAAAAAAKLSSVNVGCLICHNRNALVHKWTDGYPVAGAVYGSKDGSHPGAFPSVRRTPILRESILCGQCHGTGPTLDEDAPARCGSTYGSFLFGYRAEGGALECQGCHMGEGRGHSMRGSVEGGGEPLHVSASARSYLWRDGSVYVPRVAVTVEILNRTGHSLPDGPFPDRRLRLEITAADESGAEIWRRTRTFGPLAAAGAVAEPAPHSPVPFLPESTLPPLVPVKERADLFLAPLSEDVKAPARVSVRVRLFREGDPAAAAGGKGLYEFRRDLTFEAGR